MGNNAVSQNNLITLASLDALYNRLYVLTNTHKNSVDQLNKSLPAAKASSGLSSNSPITTAPLSELKQELTNLAGSNWYTKHTVEGDSNATTYMTDYGSSLTIPSVGELLSASDFNLIENAITSAEAIVPNYGTKYGTRYGTAYGVAYSSKYGTAYSTRYGSRYGTDYGSRYGTAYSSKYSRDYTFQYSGQYRACFSRI